MRRQGLFFDNKHFPRGFGKSGQFTIAESQCLESFGSVMNKLSSGEWLPEEDDESLFMEEIKRLEGATLPQSKVWLKYQRLTTQKRPSYTLCGGKRASNSGVVSFCSDDYMDDDDD